MMGLILPQAPDWTYTVNNYPDARGANVPTAGVGYGVGFTAAANNTKGSTVALIGPFTHNVERLLLAVTGVFLSTANGSALADIMVDYAGGTSWESVPLIPNLNVGGTRLGNLGAVTSAMSTAYFDIPVFIPAGASIGIRAQTAHSSNITTGECVALAYGGNSNPGSFWSARAFEEVGINTADSGMTAVTPGSTNAWGSWTSIGSTLAFPCKAIIGMAGCEGDNNFVGREYELQFGVNSQQIGETILYGMQSTECFISFLHANSLIHRSFPAGTQLQARIRSTSTPQNLDVGFLALR